MQRNLVKKCKVCESKINVCFHYGVCTCRACGAFFSKCICLQKQLWEKCKKCRLDKCFSVGMKKLDIGYVRKDICREAMEEQRNEINKKYQFILKMQSNFVKKCKVCGTKDNVCFHYGVCTCRACGAFFRRYLENEKKSKYSKCKCLPNQLLLEENKEEKSGTHWDKCKKCRLDICFSVGMKKLDVGYVRQDVCRKAMEKQKNQINESV
uniref:Nuclear receptor domain-containing protein n=1 Tax=Meloidogyne incognita TaxID=6306 RepID=A0A914KJQ6_MELIC